MILRIYYGQRNYILKLNLGSLGNVSFTFDFKKLLENELRFVTDVVLVSLYFAMLEV